MRTLVCLTALIALLGCDDADPGPAAADGGGASGELDASPDAEAVPDMADDAADGGVPDQGGPDQSAPDQGAPDGAVDGSAPDARVADAAPVGAAPTIEIITVPRRFNDCWESCTVQTLRFTVEDPDGMADLAGGRVLAQPSGAVLAELPAMTRRHEVDLTWRGIHQVQSIDFDEGEQPLSMRIEYRDQAGNVATADVETRLVCTDGGPACAGRCAAGDCFPFVRECGANRACEYHLAPGGREGGWTCDRTGAGRTGALCGPDLPCASGFSCLRRDAVGCDDFAPGDGCCTPRCRPGADDCPDGMRCRPRGGDQACAERLGFCAFE